MIFFASKLTISPVPQYLEDKCNRFHVRSRIELPKLIQRRQDPYTVGLALAFRLKRYAEKPLQLFSPLGLDPPYGIESCFDSRLYIKYQSS